MFKYFVFIIGLFLFQINSFSQIKNQDTVSIDNHEYVLFNPSSELNSKIQNGLRIRYSLLKLKTHPKINLNEEEYKSYSQLMDTLLMLDNITFVDSLSIVLKNGLSWNLNSDPPPAPKNFNRKTITKKGQKSKAVTDRLKYLQFCYKWKEIGEFPGGMVDKFVSYQRIEMDNVKYLEILYELKFNKDKSTRFTKKEIMIRSDLD